MSFCDELLRPLADDFLVIPDTGVDKKYRNHALVLGPPYIKFYASTIIQVNNQKLGSLCAIGSTPLNVDEGKVLALVSLGKALSTLLEESNNKRAIRRFSEVNIFQHEKSQNAPNESSLISFPPMKKSCKIGPVDCNIESILANLRLKWTEHIRITADFSAVYVIWRDSRRKHLSYPDVITFILSSKIREISSNHYAHLGVSFTFLPEADVSETADSTNGYLMATIEAAYHEPRLGGKRRSFLADEDGANSQSVQMDDNTLSTVLHSVGGTLNTCKRSDDFHEILVWEYSFPYKVCGPEEPPPAYASTERTTVGDISPELSGHTSTAGDMIGHYMGSELVGGMTNGHMAPVQLRSPRKSRDNIKVSEKAVLRISKSEAEAEDAAVYSGR